MRSVNVDQEDWGIMSHEHAKSFFPSITLYFGHRCTDTRNPRVQHSYRNLKMLFSICYCTALRTMYTYPSWVSHEMCHPSSLLHFSRASAHQSSSTSHCLATQENKVRLSPSKTITDSINHRCPNLDYTPPARGTPLVHLGFAARPYVAN